MMETLAEQNPPDTAPSALDVLQAAAAVGLPGGRRPIGAEPFVLSATALTMATTHRVQGLLCAAIDAGVVVGDDDMLASARAAHVAALRTCLVSEATALLALEALARHDVEARVLKGVAIAHLDHDDPAERVFGDVDVLVRRADHHTALRALVDAGFTRSKPPIRSWWEQRFAKAIVFRAPWGAELDVHFAIAGGDFGYRIDHGRLWATPSRAFDLGGHQARGLDAEGRLLQACCHAVLGVRPASDPGLRVKRDIAQLVLVTGADWRATVECASNDGVDLVVAEAVRTTWSELSLDPEHPLSQWARDHVATQQQRKALQSYQSAFDVGWAPEGRGSIKALGPLQRVLFIIGLAVPSRASLRWRGRTWRQHLRIGWPTLRSRA